MRDNLPALRYKPRKTPFLWNRQMDNLKISLISLVALVVALGLIGGTLVFAPHFTVLAATIASLSYIAGMVVMTLGR